MGAFRDPYAAPAEMVNWRSLIVNARPAIGNTSGVVLFLALAAVTALTMAWATRGPWRTGSVKLDLQLGAVLVGTFLVSYHSHVHGLVLLAVPLAAVWRAASDSPRVRLSILAFVFLPTLTLFAVTALWQHLAIDYDAPLWVVWPVWNVALLALLLGAILLELLSTRSPATEVRTEFDAFERVPSA
jgi:hypothetical protein